MSSKKLKYQEYTNKISNCPPISYKELDARVFRWVFPECDDSSFTPVLVIDPARQLGDDDKTCEGYALSMFEQEKGAYQKFKKLVKN